jgi:hypothetical protein
MKKGRNERIRNQEVSPQQQEILGMLTEERMTPKQIALRRKTHLSAVYKTIKKLRNKGLLGFKTIRAEGVEKIRSTITPHQIRLHGVELNIKILWKDERYKEKIGKVTDIDGTTIKTYNNSIEIYLNKSFYAEDEHKSTKDMLEYARRLITRIENDFNIILIKARSQNIQVVNAHYAETNNEYAQELEKQGKLLKIHTTDDGKLWFVIDNSFNLHERETLHPKTAKDDSETISAFFNDIRDKNPPIMSKLIENLQIISEQQRNTQAQIRETATGLNTLTKWLEKQLPKEKKGRIRFSKEKPDYYG